MPWLPDFVSAVELLRRETRAAGQADPVGQYFAALNAGDPRPLEDVWPGEVIVHDPRAGVVRGHRELRRFVRRNESWLAGLHAHTVTVASTTADGRAVVELLAYLDGDAGQMAWPVAVVAENPDEWSVVFRTYCSQWPVDGQRHLRPPILPPGNVQPGDVVGRYQQALAAGDVDALVSTFAPDGYLREPFGARTHLGPDELRAFFQGRLADGGVGIEPCVVTDDGVRCAVEYNCVRWGGRALPPQAGIAVYERGQGGLLAAVRVYDDIEAPSVKPSENAAEG